METAIYNSIQGLAIFLFIMAAAEFAVLLKGCYALRRITRAGARDDTAVLLKSPLAPPISVLATARDLSPETRDFVRRLIGLHYGAHELIVALNGPSKAELRSWIDEFRLVRSARASSGRGVYVSTEPLRLLVIDQEAGSEADSLNAALRLSTGAVLAIFDPRSEFEPEALLKLIRPMLEDWTDTAAVCGFAPAFSSDSWPARFFSIESVRQWLARCGAFSGWRMLLPVPGSAVLFRRDSVLEAGGFAAGALEMALQIHGLARTGEKRREIRLLSTPVSCLRPPASLRALRESVIRDQNQIGRGIAYRKSYPLKGRAIGLGILELVLVRLLRPLAETSLYLLAAVGLAMGWVPLAIAAVVAVATVGIGILVSMAAVVLRELALHRGADPAILSRIFFASIPENLGYRQVRNLWLVAGFFRGLGSGGKTGRTMQFSAGNELAGAQSQVQHL